MEYFRKIWHEFVVQKNLDNTFSCFILYIFVNLMQYDFFFSSQLKLAANWKACYFFISSCNEVTGRYSKAPQLWELQQPCVFFTGSFVSWQWMYNQSEKKKCILYEYVHHQLVQLYSQAVFNYISTFFQSFSVSFIRMYVAGCLEKLF